MVTRRPFHSPARPIPTSRSLFPNSHRIISFADPHLLNPVISYRCENHRGQGVTFFRPKVILSLRCSRLSLFLTITLSPSAATLTRIHISIDYKGLTGKLRPLDATLTRNKGEGGTSFKPKLLSLFVFLGVRTFGRSDPQMPSLHPEWGYGTF
jgi:hypothetical protein